MHSKEGFEGSICFVRVVHAGSRLDIGEERRQEARKAILALTRYKKRCYPVGGDLAVGRLMSASEIHFLAYR